MTTRRKVVLGFSAVLAVGLVAAPLLFAHGRGGWHRGGLGRMAHVLHDLDLTEQQKDALHRIHDEARERNRASKQALHDGLMEAAKRLIADPNDVAGARQAIAAREKAIGDLKNEMLTAVSQALTVLTPEQRAKLLERLEDHEKELNR